MGFGGGTIAFDRDGETHRFGNQLEEGEARKIVQVLSHYPPADAIGPDDRV